MSANEPPKVVLRPPPGQRDSLQGVAGSRYNEVNVRLLSQTIHAQWYRTAADEAERDEQRLAAAYTMAEIKPRDEIEGMLVAQMIAAHAGAMECHRRAMIPDQSGEGRNLNLKYADRLSRAYVELLAALQKYRGKGQQHVTVKHVHVHDGGQAIVGTVQAGGGAAQEAKDQPHAPEGIGYDGSANVLADGAALPCQDPEEQPVPVARNAERPMPHARRRQPRRTAQ